MGRPRFRLRSLLITVAVAGITTRVATAWYRDPQYWALVILGFGMACVPLFAPAGVLLALLWSIPGRGDDRPLELSELEVARLMSLPRFRIRGVMVAIAVLAAYLAAFHAGPLVGEVLVCWTIPPLILAPLFFGRERSP